MLKCTQFDFRWGSAPDPLAGFKVPTSKGREAKWREGMESGGKNEGPTTTKGERRKWIGGREWEGREEEGICRTNVKLLPTPLHQLCAKSKLVGGLSRKRLWSF